MHLTLLSLEAVCSGGTYLASVATRPILSLQRVSSVTLGKLNNLSEQQMPLLEHGENSLHSSQDACQHPMTEHIVFKVCDREVMVTARDGYFASPSNSYLDPQSLMMWY